MDAIKPAYFNPFYSEACRLADMKDIPPHEHGEFISRTCTALAVQAFRRDIEPYTKARADVLAMKPTVGVLKDGRWLAAPPELSPTERELFALLDEVIATIARGYGLEWPPHA